MTQSSKPASLNTQQKAALLRDIKINPDRFLVFIGKDAAILDVATSLAQEVSRTVALAAIQYGRMVEDAKHKDGTTYAAPVSA